MTVQKLIARLKVFPPTAHVLIANDEELNTLYEEFEVAILSETGEEPINEIVIYGLNTGIRMD